MGSSELNCNQSRGPAETLSVGHKVGKKWQGSFLSPLRKLCLHSHGQPMGEWLVHPYTSRHVWLVVAMDQEVGFCSQVRLQANPEAKM